VHVEPLGGETPTIHVSGLTGKGLDDLVETISLVSEMQDLRAERDGPVQGYVLESNFVKGFGLVSSSINVVLPNVHAAPSRLFSSCVAV
jgi:translation initiation factor IF-2